MANRAGPANINRHNRVAVNKRASTASAGGNKYVKKVRKNVKRSSATASRAAVEAIMLSQVLPVENPPVRIRDQFTSGPTAVAQPSTKYTLAWAGAGTNPVIPATQALVFISRDPLHALMFSNNGTGVATVYNWFAWASSTNNNPFTLAPFVTNDLNPFVSVYSTGTAYHGNNLFPYIDQEGWSWIQCDAPFGNATAATSNITVPITTNGQINDKIEFILYQWGNGARKVFSTVQQTLGAAGPFTAAVFTIPQTDRYHLQIVYTPAVGNGAGVLTVGQVTQNWNCGTLCNQALPGLTLTKAAQVQSIRILGASVKVSNETADQFKTGSVTAVQMKQGDNYLRIYNAAGGGTTTPYDLINQVRGSMERPFNNGYYGFLKYGEEEDTFFVNPFSFDSTGTPVTAGSPVLPVAGWLAIAISAVDSTGNGRGQVVMTFNYNVEYLTTDSWTAVDIARTIPEDHEDANEAISSMEQHYENPIHWGKIWATVGRLAGVAGRILTAIPHPYAQAGAQVANAVSGAANSLT